MSEHGHDDYAFDAAPGLPEALPAGERVLWQGGADWRVLARQAYRIRWVAGYLGAFLAWQATTALADGAGVLGALRACSIPLALSLTGLGLLAGLAWASARGSVYTITNRRVVLRHGIALPMTVNLPYSQIDAAAATTASDGSGQIALTLAGTQRLGYLLMWPYVRPLHYTRTQPSLRGLAAVRPVAAVLAQALAQSANQPANQPAVVSESVSPAPVRGTVPGLGGQETAVA